MPEPKKYIQLSDLEVYRLARELSKLGWEVYQNLDWQTRKVMGDQFIESIDSIGANIAEGYRRYHYLDQIKFYYNARASFAEACDHWLELLQERKKVTKEKYDAMKRITETLSIKLNNFIAATYRSKRNEQ